MVRLWSGSPWMFLCGILLLSHSLAFAQTSATPASEEVEECVPKVLGAFKAERTVFDPFSEGGYAAAGMATLEVVQQGLDFIDAHPCPTGCTMKLDEGTPHTLTYPIDDPGEYDDCVRRSGSYSATASATGPGCNIAALLLGSELMNGMNERIQSLCGPGCKPDRWYTNVSGVNTSSFLGICTASASYNGYVACTGENVALGRLWKIIASFEIGRICIRPIIQDPPPSPSPSPTPTETPATTSISDASTSRS